MNFSTTPEDRDTIAKFVSEGLARGEKFLALHPNGSVQSFYNRAGLRSFNAIPLIEVASVKNDTIKYKVLSPIGDALVDALEFRIEQAGKKAQDLG